MDKAKQSLPSKVHYERVSLLGSLGGFFQTRLWLQLFLFLAAFSLCYVLFHHYLPTYRELWYDLAPSDKELVFDSSDQMQFVDEKNGEFLIWYESYPDRYRFFNGPGFYGAGKQREHADTEAKIIMLKQWVDQNAATKKNKQDQTQQKQSEIDDLNTKINDLAAANIDLQKKLDAANANSAALQKSNDELAGKLASAATSGNSVPVPAVPTTATPDTPIVESPAFYRHGAIIPPNPKPDAWFESLTWGKLTSPYKFNPGNGFFEIPGQPESRIAPHPHLVLRNNKTGLFDRPYLLFIKIHGPPPASLQIPPLEDEYYRTLERNMGAVFNFKYPYQVSLGGVPY